MRAKKQSLDSWCRPFPASKLWHWSKEVNNTGLYRDNGKGNGNYKGLWQRNWRLLGVRDNGKENGSYYLGFKGSQDQGPPFDTMRILIFWDPQANACSDDHYRSIMTCGRLAANTRQSRRAIVKSYMLVLTPTLQKP